jgi:hypothetical protein
MGGGAAGGGSAGGGGGGTGGGSAGGGTGGAGGGGGIPVSCIDDTDCPDPQLFFCDTTLSQCRPACRTRAQCAATARGMYALAYCDSNPLGCQCDEGQCVVALCAQDSDCGTLACRNGACVTPPLTAAVASCEVSPSIVLMRAGVSERFSVLARDAAGAPVVLQSGVTWSTLNPALALTGPNGGPSATFAATLATNQTSPGAPVRATIGTITCTADTLLFGAAVPSGAVEVVVTDASTGRPVTGVSVVASDPSSGVVLAGPVLTSTAGWARLTGLSVTAVSVTAFHADFDYLTVASYPMTGTRALAFPLQPTATSSGGRKGTFTNVTATSDMHIGTAGLSFGASYGEISQLSLQGPPVMTHVQIGSAINQDTEISSGVFLSFSAMAIKPTVASFTWAGATRTAWAFTGDIPLGDVPVDALASGTPDMTLVLQRSSPSFRKLFSAVTRDVGYSLRPTPLGLDGGFDYSDLTQLTAVDQPWNQVPLAMAMVATVPDLPRFGGVYLDDAVLLGAALVPGRGLVPLGMGVGANRTPVDAKLDLANGLVTPGQVPLRLAPLHHGLEGSPYVITVHARSARVPSATTLATAGVVMRMPNNAPRFDPSGLAPLVLPAFAPLPEGALWSGSARAFGFASPLQLTGQSAVQLTFKTAAGPRWTVVTSPQAPAFTLPAAPATFVDRTLLRPGGPAAPMRAEVLRLQPDQSGATVGFTALVEQGAINLDNLLTTTVAFSVVEQL